MRDTGIVEDTYKVISVVEITVTSLEICRDSQTVGGVWGIQKNGEKKDCRRQRVQGITRNLTESTNLSP